MLSPTTVNIRFDEDVSDTLCLYNNEQRSGMREIEGDTTDQMPSIKTDIMPSNKPGWSRAIQNDYVVWDVTDSKPYVTMKDISGAGWVNQNIKLEAFDKASYSWDRFSHLVALFGAAQFGIWMARAANEAFNEVGIRVDDAPHKRYDRASDLLATEIDSRSYTMKYFEIPTNEADELLIFSFMLAPNLNERFDWLGAIEVRDFFGIGNAVLLQTYGYDMPSLIHAARSNIDPDLMLSTAMGR